MEAKSNSGVWTASELAERWELDGRSLSTCPAHVVTPLLGDCPGTWERQPALAGGFYRAHKCFIVHSEQQRLLGCALLSRVWKKTRKGTYRRERYIIAGTSYSESPRDRSAADPRRQSMQDGPYPGPWVISIGMILPFMLA